MTADGRSDHLDISTLSMADMRENLLGPASSDEVTEPITDEPTPPLPSNRDSGSFFASFLAAKGSLRIVLLAFSLSLAIGPLISAVPDVVEDRYARLNHRYDGPHCSSFDRSERPEGCQRGGDDAQSAAAKCAFVQNVFILLSNSIVGSMSDCRGRKMFLALSFFIAALVPVALFLLQILQSMNPFWFYAANASSGLINGLSVSFTMLSDLMEPSYRAPAYGILFSSYMFGFALSQILAFYMSHITVSALSASLLFASFLFSALAVPETLPVDARKRAQIRIRSEAAAAGLWCSILRPCWEMSILGRDRVIGILSAVAFCSGLVYSSDKTLVVYYMEDVLGVPYRDVAIMFFLMALLGIVCQVVVLKAAIGWLGEKRLLVVTCVCGAAHNVLYGIASTRGTMFVGLCVSQLTSLTLPVQISMRSNHVDDAEQGRVQGAFQSLMAVSDAVGPLMLQFIFRRTEDGAALGPGTMFLFAAAIYFGGGLIACSLPTKKVNLRRLNPDGASIGESGSAHEPLLSGCDEEHVHEGER